MVEAGGMEEALVHVAVMVQEVIEALACAAGKRYVDCTVGTGGHAQAILECVAPGGSLLGIDRDPEALEVAGRRLESRSFTPVLVWGNFADLGEILRAQGWEGVDGVLFDLGVSTRQLENPRRGFSFQREGPLDMRMDPQTDLTAADLLRSLSEGELRSLISAFGEERWAGRIARRIVAAREREPIASTRALAEIVARAIPAKARRGGIHPATRTFQALRIAVNRELDQLPRGLEAAAAALRPGGRLVVLSYHSLEDRIVKQFLREGSSPGEGGLEGARPRPRFRVLTPKPLRPGADEVTRNPRARSARLRIGERAD